MKYYVNVNGFEIVQAVYGEYGEGLPSGFFEVLLEGDVNELFNEYIWTEGGLKHIGPAPFPQEFYRKSEQAPYWLLNLDAARVSQRQAWNTWRDRELIAGYTHNGYVFHSDDTFIGELQLLLKGYERGHLTGTSAIRTRDNGTLQMTHTEIEGLLLLIGLHRQAIYAQSWAGKDALASLTTLEDIVAGGPPTLE